MPDCEICGKKMYKFENPERYVCRTSDGEHERLRKEINRHKNSSAAMEKLFKENPEDSSREVSKRNLKRGRYS